MWTDRGSARAREPRGSDVAPEGRRFLVFIDDYFTSRRYRAAVLEKMAEDLDQLGPADRMAIVRFGGRQLELVSDWSASAPELGALLRQAKRKATGELPRQNRLRTSGGGVDHVELLEQQVKEVSSTVTAALRSFADAPGRKVLLLVSSGWPYHLPAGQGPGVRFAQQRRGGLQLLLRHPAAAAARAAPGALPPRSAERRVADHDPGPRSEEVARPARRPAVAVRLVSNES